MSLNIVVLDGAIVNPGDLSWHPIEQYGKLSVFTQTKEEQIISRSKNADIILVNKVVLRRDHFQKLSKLKLVCLLASGYDNVDISAASDCGIVVCNAMDYGSDSVAQHVFAMILAGTNQVVMHNQSVQAGEWSNRPWSYAVTPLIGLSGKTMGIFGLGKIGSRVAEIALAFGMKVLAVKKNNSDGKIDKIEFVSQKELFEKSDIVSLHVPLSNETKRMINTKCLSFMKPGAILVNTARGGLIAEEELRRHLLANPNFTATLDVLSVEPPPPEHPLLGLKNCIITPHNAWSNIDARINLIEIVGVNIGRFISGSPINVVKPHKH